MDRKLSPVRTLTSGLLIALTFGLFLQPASAQRFITFNYPGAAQSAHNLINNHGEMVGGYSPRRGNNRGFTLLNGQFTAIDFPRCGAEQIQTALMTRVW